MKTHKLFLALMAAGTMGLTACATDNSHDMHHGAHAQVEFTGHETSLDSVEFSRCWVRLVPERPSAAYFELKNNGTETVTLIAARADNFHDVMLHQTIVEDGKGMMIGLEKLAIEPGATAVFKPKDNHVMLTADSADVVKVGDTVALQFKFEGEQVASTECIVKPINTISFD
ncbi:MAG: copper chaperone PCu(A)C [Alcaligenaceae bacterium]|nr:copper chaperone PCu(A)C [Alcaligenaceae bacterium]